ncbi:MAG: sigma-70 family RNA polymerase sigma factor [Acidobacteriota bacterium]
MIAAALLERHHRTTAAEVRRPAGPMDEQRFRAFHRRTCGPLWAYLSRACGDRSLADDLTQESYLRFLGSSFEPESDLHARRYLFRIASNLLRDRLRRRRHEGPPPEGAVEPRTPALEPGERIDLDRALRGFKERDRQVLWLCHVEGVPHHEIAEMLGLAPASVRVIAFRARKKLARILRAEPPATGSKP